jgi:hypothetical protein
MIRSIRLSLFAVLAAGVAFSAMIGRAATPYGTSTAYSGAYSNGAYASPGSSQLTLVSATEDKPQPADSSSLRSAEPRPISATLEQSAVQAAPKPAAQQSALQQTAKSVSQPTRPTTAASQQPGPRTATNAPRITASAMPKQSAPNYYPQRNGVQLTTHVVVEPGRQETVMRTPSPPPVPPASPETDTEISGGECPTCQSGCCGSCCGFCAGMEYLYLRPHFAGDAAFEQMTTTSTNINVTQVNQLVNFDEPYNSDYHFFVGYHTGCGDEFRLGYWHIADDGNRSGTASGDFLAGEGVAFQAPGATEVTVAGESVNATTHMALNIYDLDDVKRLDLPSFGCSCCPDWDVRWSYGVRIINFNHTTDYFTPFETINNGESFTGAGPKFGLEVHRQIGHSKVSAYVSGTAALLLGESRAHSTTATPGIFQTAVNVNEANGNIIVPDFNISVGLTWQPWCHTTFTGGWMFEDFGNLGTAGAATCTGCSATSGNIGGGDLSFDGLFLRAEHCF